MIEQTTKLNATVTYVFDYIDLEKLVKDLYGHEVHILRGERFIDYERLGHYTYHEWTVDGNSELDLIGDDVIVRKWIETSQMDDLDMSDVKGYWSSTANVGLEHILHRLFIEGHIPAGSYLMKVDW